MGLTKDEAARLAKVSLSTWHTVENATPDATFREITLVGVATALDLDVDTIFELAGVEIPAGETTRNAPTGTPPSRRALVQRIERRLHDLDLRSVSVLADLVDLLASDGPSTSDEAREDPHE